MIHVADLVAAYFEEVPALDAAPSMEELIAGHRQLMFTGHGLKGHVHAQHDNERGWHLTLFVPDRVIDKTGQGWMRAPLEKAEASRMNYYKLYLSVVAYLSGYRKIGSLRINQAYTPEVHFFDYKPQHVKALLAHFDRHVRPGMLRPEERTKEKPLTLTNELF